MRFGSARGRSLLLLIALLATLVMLGCWDARRGMQRVLDQGYATTAQLTGAQVDLKNPKLDSAGFAVNDRHSAVPDVCSVSNRVQLGYVMPVAKWMMQRELLRRPAGKTTPVYPVVT